MQRRPRSGGDKSSPIPPNEAMLLTADSRVRANSNQAHFPSLLHSILQTAEQCKYDHIISWRPHGKSFHVHDRELFVSQVLPLFVRQTKFASFQRQLNLYGFQRFSQKNPDHGGYYHKLMIRDRTDLCAKIERVGKSYAPGIREKDEPNFYSQTAEEFDSAEKEIPVVQESQVEFSSPSVAANFGSSEPAALRVPAASLVHDPANIEPLSIFPHTWRHTNVATNISLQGIAALSTSHRQGMNNNESVIIDDSVSSNASGVIRSNETFVGRQHAMGMDLHRIDEYFMPMMEPTSGFGQQGDSKATAPKMQPSSQAEDSKPAASGPLLPHPLGSDVNWNETEVSNMERFLEDVDLDDDNER